MKILIKKCSDSLFWYADKVGETVPFVSDMGDQYLSREPTGYLNIVKYEDSELIEDNK